MKKLLVLFLLFVSSMFNAAFAEKIPVRITPLQIISTNNDEIEIGDWIKFAIVNDVFVDNKLYLKKGAPIFGFVDFFHPNGWVGDNAEIKFKTFKTIGINDKPIIINYPLNINGNTARANDIKQYISWVLTTLVRGSEIYIEPDTKTFNIFIER